MNGLNVAIVGGTFDHSGGRPSGYVKRLADAIFEAPGVGHGDLWNHLWNGGPFDLLPDILVMIERLRVDVLVWMADVPNDLPKIVGTLKQRWPKILLVTSKNNMDQHYSIQDLLGRALASKSNLLVEISGSRTDVRASILDPLGGAYALFEGDVVKVATVLVRRLARLRAFRRVGSERVGDRISPPDDAEALAFYGAVREQAERFHAIIHGPGHERMLGNASFRCAKGFPSARRGDLAFVSRRNVDKRSIGPEAFVAVELGPDYSIFGEPPPVCYHGDDKPSVDTPIQVALYRYYEDVRFMVHSHTYVEGAEATREPIPCGAVEEAEAVFELFPSRVAKDFAVNLVGHGSIVLASSVEGLSRYAWTARRVPELFPVMDDAPFFVKSLRGTAS